jgi:hypothetical protein
MANQPFDTISLGNGLSLEIWDNSRKVAGNRWLVSMEIRIDIPLSIGNLGGLTNKEEVFSALKAEYGDKVTYRHELEKHFVDDNKKKEVFNKFMETAREDLFAYLSHPNFAKKFTLLKYKKLKTQDPRLFI